MGRTYRLQGFWQNHLRDTAFQAFVDLIGGERTPGRNSNAEETGRPAALDCSRHTAQGSLDYGGYECHENGGFSFDEIMFDHHLAWDALEGPLAAERTNRCLIIIIIIILRTNRCLIIIIIIIVIILPHSFCTLSALSVTQYHSRFTHSTVC